MRTFNKSLVVTHTRNLIKIARRIDSQSLDRDLASLMFTHPHVGVPAAVQCFL